MLCEGTVLTPELQQALPAGDRFVAAASLSTGSKDPGCDLAMVSWMPELSLVAGFPPVFVSLPASTACWRLAAAWLNGWSSSTSTAAMP